jgi:hypothetical protein
MVRRLALTPAQPPLGPWGFAFSFAKVSCAGWRSDLLFYLLALGDVLDEAGEETTLYFYCTLQPANRNPGLSRHAPDCCETLIKR